VQVPKANTLLPLVFNFKVVKVKPGLDAELLQHVTGARFTDTQKQALEAEDGSAQDWPLLGVLLSDPATGSAAAELKAAW
jgi:hypothetical protein